MTLAAAGGGTDGTAVEGAGASDVQAAPRSDPRERRGRLRALDPILAEEVRLAGALSCDELVELAKRPLNDRASRATIMEWWEYAWRRGWLVPHEADLFQLTDRARADLRERREHLWQPNPFEWAKALAVPVVPLATAGIGYAAGKSGAITEVILWVCVALVVAFVLAGLIVLAIDRPTDRRVAIRACDWLDGRRLWWFVERRSDDLPSAIIRLYSPPVADQAPDCSGS